MTPLTKAESTKDMMMKRSKLMIEVTKMRKEYPPKLSRIDQRIHCINLKKISSVSFSSDSLKDDFTDYAKRRPEENIVIPNFKDHKQSMQWLQKSIVDNESIHTEILRRKDSYSTTRCKVDRVLEDLNNLCHAHKQLLNESRILKKVREEIMKV